MSAREASGKPGETAKADIVGCAPSLKAAAVYGPYRAMKDEATLAEEEDELEAWLKGKGSESQERQNMQQQLVPGLP